MNAIKTNNMQRKFLFIILLAFAWMNLSGRNEIFNTNPGQGDGYGMSTSRTTAYNGYNNYSGNNGDAVYQPFDTYSQSNNYYNQVLRGSGDRPNIGDGIGVTPIKDSLYFFSFIIIVYGLRIRYKLVKISKN